MAHDPRFAALVRTFPSTDRAFRDAVDELVQVHSPATPAELQALLRPSWPAASVREREALASVDEGRDPVWYVFRDGDGPG